MFILNRRYPFQQGGHWLRECVVYSVIVFLILYFLQPFGISVYKGNSNGYKLELGGGCVTVPVSRSYVPKLRSFIA